MLPLAWNASGSISTGATDFSLHRCSSAGSSSPEYQLSSKYAVTSATPFGDPTQAKLQSSTPLKGVGAVLCASPRRLAHQSSTRRKRLSRNQARRRHSAAPRLSMAVKRCQFVYTALPIVHIRRTHEDFRKRTSNSFASMVVPHKALSQFELGGSRVLRSEGHVMASFDTSDARLQGCSLHAREGCEARFTLTASWRQQCTGSTPVKQWPLFVQQSSRVRPRVPPQGVAMDASSVRQASELQFALDEQLESESSVVLSWNRLCRPLPALDLHP